MPPPTWKSVRIYAPIRGVIRGWPDVRPMPTLGPGASEIRIADRGGSYRTFHAVHGRHGVLVFHAFTKKTQKTPRHEIEVGRIRLRGFLIDLGE